MIHILSSYLHIGDTPYLYKSIYVEDVNEIGLYTKALMNQANYALEHKSIVKTRGEDKMPYYMSLAETTISKITVDVIAGSFDDYINNFYYPEDIHEERQFAKIKQWQKENKDKMEKFVK